MAEHEQHSLCILPWLRLRRDLHLGAFHFLRWPRSDEAIPRELGESVSRIAGLYRTILGRSRESSVIMVEAVPSSLPSIGHQAERYAKAADLLGVALIGENEYYVQHGRYVNATALRPIFHNFRVGVNQLAMESRTRESSFLDAGFRYEQIAVTEPYHCRYGDSVSAPENVLAALGTVLDERDDLDRLVVQASSLMMQACTDAPDVLPSTELVMMANALDRLMGSPGSAKNLASRVGELLEPYGAVTLANSNRIAARSIPVPKKGATWFLSKQWAFELYEMRSKLSHGNDLSAWRWTWEPYEQLVLGAFLVPLCVKLRLAQCGRYALTDDDLGTLSVMEGLLDTDRWGDFDGGSRKRWDVMIREGRCDYHLDKLVRQQLETLTGREAQD